MNSFDQNDQNLGNQIGFGCFYTFGNTTQDSKLIKSNFLISSTNEDKEKFEENQLRIKLVQIFTKDRKKYFSMCDRFMQFMDLDNICQNIKSMNDFISQTISKGTKTQFQLTSNSNIKICSRQISKKSQHFDIVSNNLSFLVSIFNRDKMQVILQVQSVYQKIQNFLSCIQVPLQFFNFTNEKQWILMKDQIQRCLIKYEKNVNQILEINEGEFRQSKKDKLKFRKKQCTIFGDIFTSNKLNHQLESQLNLKQYKRDIVEIRFKIKEQMMTMSAAIRNSFISWYEKFQILLDDLRQQLAYICDLVEKAERFQQSTEKQQIIDFLLATRAKGLEGIIFMEQIYKCIVVKLEQSRVLLSYIIQSTCFKKLGFSEREKMQFSIKEQSAKQNIERILSKFQACLKIKVDRNFLHRSQILVIDESESQMLIKREQNDQVKERNLCQFGGAKFQIVQIQEYSQKDMVKTVKKQKRIKKQNDHRKHKNIILQSCQARKLAKQVKKQRIAQNISQLDEQKESSSLEFLRHENLPQSPKEEHMLKSPQKGTRSIAQNCEAKGNLKSLGFEEIESLSIEANINFGEMNGQDQLNESAEFGMFQKGFKDEDIEQIQKLNVKAQKNQII